MVISIYNPNFTPKDHGQKGAGEIYRKCWIMLDDDVFDEW